MSHAYPDDWKSFRGQAPVKELLQAAVSSARQRNEPMDHVLIHCSDGGMGKSALAHLVAKDLGSNLVIVSEAIETNAARRILDQMDDFDVLFLDEVHRFAKCTWLHHLMQEGKMTGRAGRLVDAPRITIIGATTDPNKLDDTILSRFQYIPVLKPYTLAEATGVAEVMASTIFVDSLRMPEHACLSAVAGAANHVPRVIEKLLRTLRDLALTGKTDWVEGFGWDLDRALQFRGLHLDGLSDLAVDYLKVLRQFNGQAGESTIAGVLGERAGLVTVERLLLSKGYIEREKTGRVLTRAGRNRIELEEDTAAA